jgi:hypothetical protein
VSRYYQALIGFAFAAAVSFLTVLCIAGCGGPHTGRFVDMIGWRLLQMAALVVGGIGIVGTIFAGSYYGLDERASKAAIVGFLLAAIAGSGVLVATWDYGHAGGAP